MINFFTKHKKVRGVITVFLTMIYLSVYLLIGVFVDGGRIRMTQTMIEDVQQIATENVMSQYNRGLYEYYGLFGVNTSVEEVSNDVKNQIEQSLGFKVSDDLIKSLLKDVTSSKSDKWGKPFNPYGLEVDSVNTTYIDLTETEAMRAQMRDEMRYKGLMAISENFFATVAELMSFMDSVNAVKTITEEIGKDNGAMDYANKFYYKSLDDFSKEFKGFVELSYDTDEPSKFEKVASAAKNIGIAVTEFFKDPVNALKNLWDSLFHREEPPAPVAKGDKVDENGDLPVETNLNLKKAKNTGQQTLLEIITSSKNSLTRFYDEFDSYDGWSEGSDFVYADDEDDEDAEEYYHADEHYSAVSSDLSRVAGKYKSDIQGLVSKINTTLDRLNTSITYNDQYRGIINGTISHFKEECDKVDENDTKTKNIYLNYIETYLRQWNSVAEQKIVLDNLNEKLNNIKSILEQAINDIEDLSNEILGELSDSWTNPSGTLESRRRSDVIGSSDNSFHNIMLNMVEEEDGLKTVQDTANGDEEQQNIFSVINKAQGENKVEEESDQTPFGEILKHEPSTNVIFNVKDYTEKKMEKLGDDGKDFDKDNVTKKIGNIMDSAKKIIEDLPKSVVDNIYDEAYILTYCRDYVHTYRYKQLSDEKKEHKNIDKIFNKKFVEDRSSTEYLSDSQLEKLQVTPAEIEYILWGNESSYANIATMYVNIFIIRLALNYIAAITSPASAAEIHGLAAAALVFAPVVEVAAPLIYAMPQAINETRKIMYECQKVNLYNGGPHLHLWDGIKEIAVDVGSEAINNAKEVAKKTYKDARDNLDDLMDISTMELISSVKDNVGHISNSDNIGDAAKYLENMINAGKYESFTKDLLKEFDDEVNSAIDNVAEEAEGAMKDALSHITVITVNDSAIKVGYSDYLLIYLFLGGAVSKKTQIDRLQNIIETNMRISEAGDDNFRLKNTYSQIGVESQCKMKYIFMSQAIMGSAFSKVEGIKDYNKFLIKTKTSFAY